MCIITYTMALLAAKCKLNMYSGWVRVYDVIRNNEKQTQSMHLYATYAMNEVYVNGNGVVYACIAYGKFYIWTERVTEK